MKESIYNLMETASNNKFEPQLREYAKLNKLEIVENEADAEGSKVTRASIVANIRESQEFMYSVFTGKNFAGETVETPTITMNEALHTSDASIVLPRVIMEVLQEPTEPNLWLQSIADDVRLPDGSPSYIEFPSVGAIEASDIAEGMEYPEQEVAFGDHMTSLRIKKCGVKTAVTEEIIKHSMWNLVTLHLRLMGNAIARHIENKLYKTFTSVATTVFDNESATTAMHTTGLAKAQTGNGSIAYLDIVKLCTVLLNNRYNFTDLVTHPLAWPILAQDPTFRAQMFHAGQMGIGGVYGRTPDYNQQAMMPFGLNHVPYYNTGYSENKTLSAGWASGLGASLVTDLYVIDRKNTLFLGHYGPTEFDSMEDWQKDARAMKARRYVGVSAKDGGRGITVAKNVRVVVNYEPIYTIQSVSA